MLNVGVQGLPSHEIASKLTVGAGTACANCIGTWQWCSPRGLLPMWAAAGVRLNYFASHFRPRFSSLAWLPRKRAHARRLGPARAAGPSAAPAPCLAASHTAGRPEPYLSCAGSPVSAVAGTGTGAWDLARKPVRYCSPHAPAGDVVSSPGRGSGTMVETTAFPGDSPGQAREQCSRAADQALGLASPRPQRPERQGR